VCRDDLLRGHGQRQNTVIEKSNYAVNALSWPHFLTFRSVRLLDRRAFSIGATPRSVRLLDRPLDRDVAAQVHVNTQFVEERGLGEQCAVVSPSRAVECTHAVE
jgi:hypothetical protein